MVPDAQPCLLHQGGSNPFSSLVQLDTGCSAGDGALGTQSLAEQSWRGRACAHTAHTLSPEALWSGTGTHANPTDICAVFPHHLRRSFQRRRFGHSEDTSRERPSRAWSSAQAAPCPGESETRPLRRTLWPFFIKYLKHNNIIKNNAINIQVLIT